jgi:serpin B
MKLLSMIAALAAALMLFSACQSAQKSQARSSNSIQESKSSAVKITSPSYNANDLKQLVWDNNEFALDLYKQVKDDSTNVIFSPYSISIGLAMAYAGARDQTETQMATTLHFNFSQDKQHLLFNAIDYELASRKQNDSTSGDKYLKLKHVNSLWAQNDYPFLNKFLDVLMMNYGTGVRLVDFSYNSEQARQDINQWIAEQTENKISELLAPGSVNRYTRLVLTNAMYFNAAWDKPFDFLITRTGSFSLENGDLVATSMMTQQTASYPVYVYSGYQALQLPYYGNEFSMLIVMPDHGTFAAFEQALNYALIENIVANSINLNVKLTMPKFSCKFGVKLKDKLSAMGMPDAFTESANFSGMDGTRNLSIGEVFHKANIIVNEAGTEASAATAVTMTYTSLPKEIVINRPFIYMIRDMKTGAILFLGRVKNPSM